MRDILLSMDEFVKPRYWPWSLLYNINQYDRLAQAATYNGIALFPLRFGVSRSLLKSGLPAGKIRSHIKMIYQSYRSETSWDDIKQNPSPLQALLFSILLPERVFSMSHIMQALNAAGDIIPVLYPPHLKEEGKIAHKVWNDSNYVKLIAESPRYTAIATLRPAPELNARWNLGHYPTAERFYQAALDHSFSELVIHTKHLVRTPGQGYPPEFAFHPISQDELKRWLAHAVAVHINFNADGQIVPIDQDLIRAIKETGWQGHFVVGYTPYARWRFLTPSQVITAHRAALFTLRKQLN